MPFDSENEVVQLCAKGIELETSDSEKAKALFLQAWHKATNDSENSLRRIIWGDINHPYLKNYIGTKQHLSSH